MFIVFYISVHHPFFNEHTVYKQPYISAVVCFLNYFYFLFIHIHKISKYRFGLNYFIWNSYTEKRRMMSYRHFIDDILIKIFKDIPINRRNLIWLKNIFLLVFYVIFSFAKRRLFKCRFGVWKQQKIIFEWKFRWKLFTFMLIATYKNNRM